MSQFSRVQALLQTDVWKRVEAEVFKELTPHQKAQISQFGSQSLFEAFLHTNLDAKKQSVDKILYHVRKATQLLQPFGVALDVLATGSGVPSEPLWCLLKFVVEVCEVPNMYAREVVFHFNLKENFPPVGLRNPCRDR